MDFIARIRRRLSRMFGFARDEASTESRQESDSSKIEEPHDSTMIEEAHDSTMIEEAHEELTVLSEQCEDTSTMSSQQSELVSHTLSRRASRVSSSHLATLDPTELYIELDSASVPTVSARVPAMSVYLPLEVSTMSAYHVESLTITEDFMEDENSTLLIQQVEECMDTGTESTIFLTQPPEKLHEGRTKDTDKGAGLECPGANSNFSDEKKIIYHNNSMVWNCEEHNFSMTFQSESLPTGTNESIVEISVTPGEDYELPVPTVPVSMFFSIKCQHKFHKNVLVSIEHFSAETSDLSFVVSSNPQPPFQFELLIGGEFNTKNCGKIDRSEFSILGIVTRIRTGRWPRMQYYCALYTSLLVDYTWTVYIYIAKNSTTNRHRIKEDREYPDKIYNASTVATVNHTTDYYILDISLTAEEELNGWTLPPRSIETIRIPRTRIDRCRGVPAPANFKILFDNPNAIRKSKLVHNYEISDVVQENTLTLVIEAPVLPAVQESPRNTIDSTYIEELQHHRSKLVTAFKSDLNWLASEFLAIGMLSSQSYDGISCTNSTLTQPDKANILVSAIMDKLDLDRKNVTSILEVLKKKPNFYRETIALLEDKKDVEKFRTEFYQSL